MTLTQYCDFFTSELGVTVYPIQFPFNTKTEDCLTFDFVYGYNLSKDTTSIIGQFQARGNHPSRPELMLEKAIKKLHNMSGRLHENCNIILIRKQTPNPYHLGQDDNGMYLFTADFIIIAEELEGYGAEY